MSEQIRRMVPRKYYTNYFADITFKTSFNNCVLKALQNRKWRQIDGTGWHLQWSEKQRVNDVFEEKLTATQRVNHFRLWSQLCRKDMLIKNIRKHKRELQKQKLFVEEDWDFLPLTFFLPSEYIMFAEDFKRKGGLWIMKPTSRCQGQGIFIVDKLSQVAPFRNKTAPAITTTPQSLKPVIPPYKHKRQQQKKNDNEKDKAKLSQSENDEDDLQETEVTAPSESYLIQQYISQPLLLGCKKFDLRIYCLCTNYSQLTAWLYRSGFARFTHEPYNTDNIDNLESHLTNVQIQKHSENYDAVRGGKWLINNLKHYMFSRFSPGRVDWCFSEIKNIILRSLQSVQKSILPGKNSFELYGYDFMIDTNLKPWLIEVNGGPSMTANTDFDCKLKCGLIDDALTIVDIEGILNGSEMTVGGFDLIVDKGVKIIQGKHSMYNTHLGAYNQRIKVMRHIVRKFLLGKKLQQQKKEDEQIEEVEEEEGMKTVKKKIQKGKEKLLPNFYYQRKIEDIDQQTVETLREDIRIIQENQNEETKANPKFKPLRFIE